MAGNGGFEILARLALEEIADAARHMRPLPGNADERPAFARLEPHDAALARPMHDPVIDAAQRHHGARLEGDGLRQPRKSRSDPCGVAFGKLARRLERGARGNRQQHIAGRRSNPEREATRRGHALERDTINLPVVGDVEMRRRLRRLALEKTQHHAKPATHVLGEPRQPVQPASPLAGANPSPAQA